MVSKNRAEQKFIFPGISIWCKRLSWKPIEWNWKKHKEFRTYVKRLIFSVSCSQGSFHPPRVSISWCLCLVSARNWHLSGVGRKNNITSFAAFLENATRYLISTQNLYWEMTYPKNLYKEHQTSTHTE